MCNGGLNLIHICWIVHWQSMYSGKHGAFNGVTIQWRLELISTHRFLFSKKGEEYKICIQSYKTGARATKK